MTYIEADLPRMAVRKRLLLRAAGLEAGGPRVMEVDALAERGPRSLAGLAESLYKTRGTALVTEGLLSYLKPETQGACSAESPIWPGRGSIGQSCTGPTSSGTG